MNCEKTPRHFQHVVDVARLVRAAVDALGQLIGWSKVFILAVATGRVSVIVDYRVPKELRRRTVLFIAAVNILLQHAEHLRHVRVAVLSFQLVFATFERLKESFVIETMRSVSQRLSPVSA